MSEISVKRKFLVIASQPTRNFPNDKAKSAQLLTYPVKDESAWNRGCGRCPDPAQRRQPKTLDK
jgi:hypothetical protein